MKAWIYESALVRLTLIVDFLVIEFHVLYA